MKIFTVLFLMSVASFAAGETYFGVGGGLNFVSVEQADPNYWITANLRLQPREHFAVEPEIAFWSGTVTNTSCFLSCSTQTVNFRDTQIGVNAYYIFQTGSIKWSVGGGAAIHFQQGTIGLFGVSDTKETNLGGQILGGADFPFTQRSSFFVMVRADFVHEFDIQRKIYGGVRFRF